MTLVQHPRHVLLAALVAGLAAVGAARGSGALIAGAPVLAVAVALAVARDGHRRAAALCLAAGAAFVLGAAAGQARVTTLDRTALPPSFGHAFAGRVVLIDGVRRRAFGLRTALVRLRGERVLLRVPASVRWRGAPVGAELAVRGGLRPPGLLGGAVRAHAELRADEVAATGRRRGGVLGRVDAVRVRAEQALQQDAPAPVAALLRGMVLGQDGALTDEMRDDFRASGLSHLVAASGQNVMLLAALAFALATAAGIGRRARLSAVLVLIALYVPLAGAGASIQRAGVMGAAGFAAAIAGRPASRWYAVLLAAAVTLALEPRACTDAGWQLSFAAVISLMALAPGLSRRLSRRGVPTGIAEALAVTLAASLATAPLLAAHFGRVSLVSLAANLLAVPAVAPVMWLGMLAAAVAQVSVNAAAPLTVVAALPAGYLAALGSAAASVPGASAAAGAGAVTLACVVLTVSLAAGGRLAAIAGPARARRIAGAGGAVGALLVVLAVAFLHRTVPPGTPHHLRITFLDVGQGDATLVQHGRAAALVDTGPPDGPVLRRLHEAGVRRLDLLVLTHAQADHDGAAAAILRSVPVDLLLDGRDGARTPADAPINAALRAGRVRSVAPATGMRIQIGAVQLRVLSPQPRPGPPDPGADPNQRAIVLELRDAAFSALLTADAESDVLAGLDLHRIDALKVSHHGSDDPGLAPVLARLAPRVAAVSVGRGNTYGHPVPATMRTLTAAVPAVYRTDRDGSVRLDVDGERVQVSTGG